MNEHLSFFDWYLIGLTYRDHIIKEEKEYKKRLKDITVDGVVYKSLTAAANAYGVNQSSVRSKVREQGYTVEGAIHSLVAYENRATVHGVKYKSYTDACKAYNVQTGEAMYYQKKYKISFEEAIDKLVAEK